VFVVLTLPNEDKTEAKVVPLTFEDLREIKVLDHSGFVEEPQAAVCVKGLLAQKFLNLEV